MEPETLAQLILQLAVLLLVAKLFGLVFKKLKQSEVLGELLGGMIIGPFALGKVDLPFLGKLFPLVETASEHAVNMPISSELYFVGQIGAVLLLFLVGLETDAKMFMKYGLKSLGIAVGGVVVPFLLGAWGTVAFGFAEKITDGPAMFMGAILTATSVGITARVLSDMYKLDTQEGVSILAAAVIDDVLGILVLALVLALAGGEQDFSLEVLSKIGLKALIFLGGVTLLGLFFGKKLSKLLLKLEGKTYTAIAAAICFLIAALAEKFGLATIIGAYLAGILLSVTKIGEELEEKLASASNIIVPIFFAIMGTLVDFKSMVSALTFGLTISGFAIIGKILGCGGPAFLSGFNLLGAIRIGVGMLPRGEVALIVAGIGLSAGIINREIFGVSILMTLVTTILAPLVLVPLFRIQKSGLKDEPSVEAYALEPFRIWQSSPHVLSAWRDFLIEALLERGYNVVLNDQVRGITNLEHGQSQSRIVTLKKTNGSLSMDCSNPATGDIQNIVSEGLAMFEDSVMSLKSVGIEAN